MRHLGHLLLALPLASLILSAAPSAQAQNVNGFALDRFDPSERGSEWFVLDSLDMRGNLRPAAGIVGDWAYKPLVLYDKNGNEVQDIVADSLVVHAGASINVIDRFRFGFNLPIALYQTGDDSVSNGISYKAPGTAIGDLRLSADARLFGKYGDVFTTAIGLGAYLPTGSRDQYMGDGTVRLAPRVIVAGDIDIFVYSARAAFDIRPLDASFAGRSLGSDISFGVAGGVRVLDKKLVVGPELYGSTVVTDGDSFFGKTTTPLEGLLGGHYTWTDFRFGAGVGTGLTRGFGSPELRTVLSAEWAPAADVDTDKDGILDSEDACPTIPGVRTSDPKTNGCPPPPPPSDRDGDTIIDPLDACPDVPGVKTDDPKTNGCPSDRDKDGIIDQLDACPDVPGVKTDDPKTNGCPPDRDKDTILDQDDACPDVPGIKTDDPKTNGCPSDRDKDTIYDTEDACPDAPGPRDPDPKKNGCPEAHIEGEQIKIKDQVQFKTNSATILPESDTLLTAVAKILTDHPEIKRVRVEGHTDNVGKAAYNKALSQKRAAAVVTWLTTKGKIDGKRLFPQGFGLEHPIDSNETIDGRQNNRRVEFHIVPDGAASPLVQEQKSDKKAAAPDGKK